MNRHICLSQKNIWISESLTELILSHFITTSSTVHSLCLTKHHAMKAYWGVEVQLHSFFDLGTRWR
jgi:hypothetical protein